MRKSGPPADQPADALSFADGINPSDRYQSAVNRNPVGTSTRGSYVYADGAAVHEAANAFGSRSLEQHPCRIYGHRRATLWFAGLSGSGKSTLAPVAEQRLDDLGSEHHGGHADRQHHRGDQRQPPPVGQAQPLGISLNARQRREQDLLCRMVPSALEGTTISS